MCQVGTSNDLAGEFTAIVRQHDQRLEEAYDIGGRDSIPVAVAAALQPPLPGRGLSGVLDDGGTAAPGRNDSRAVLVAEPPPPTAASVVVNAVPVL